MKQSALSRRLSMLQNCCFTSP